MNILLERLQLRHGADLNYSRVAHPVKVSIIQVLKDLDRPVIEVLEVCGKPVCVDVGETEILSQDGLHHSPEYRNFLVFSVLQAFAEQLEGHSAQSYS